VVEQARQTDALVLALYGDLDLASSSLLDAVLENAELDAEEHVVIDLSGLEFMDAAGLRVLVAAQQRSLQNGHRLSLLRGRRTVQRIFELTQTTTALRFDD
jgi:anti-sigma B factor antagonist